MSFKPKQGLLERADAEPGMVFYLINGKMPEDEPGVNPFLENQPARIKAAWQQIGDTVTRDFIKQHPCTRPWGWWHFDAPRWDDSFGDCWYHGALPEPRLRIGGSGRPSFESMGDVPSFSFGLPDSWPKQIDVECGLAKKRDVPDPDDPPIFESQASFLRRHDLLTSAEKGWLKKHPEALTPEQIVYTKGFLW